MMFQACETIQKLMELSQDLVQATTLDGIFVYTNPSWRAALGYGSDELLQQSFFDVLSTENQPAYWRACALAKTVGSAPITMTLMQRSGQLLEVKGHLHWQMTEVEEPTLWWVGRIKRSNESNGQRLEGSEVAPYQAIFEQAGIGINQIDLATGRFLRVNQRFCEIVGYSKAELLQKSEQNITHPDDAEAEGSALTRLVKGEVSSISIEKRYLHRDGSLRWVKLMSSVLGDRNNCPSAILNIVEDICDRKQAESNLTQQQQRLEAAVAARAADLEREIQERTIIEQQLFQEKELAQITLHSIGDGVITTDAQGRVKYLNPMAEKLTGWHGENARGRLLSAVFQVVSEATRTPLNNPVEQVLRDAKITTLGDHPLLLARNGHEYGIDCSAAPIHNRNWQIIGTVIVFRDVTQSRRATQKLSWQATHDALTQLVNRQQFEHDLTEALQEIRQRCSTHVLCYLDLDRFKVVNDTCGHSAGDELLRRLAVEIKRQVRSSDIVARLGGDEFGILLKDCSLHQAQLISEGIREQIHNFRFVWEDKTFQVGVSIGLITLDDVKQSVMEVMNAADAACYAAKDSGRNRIHVYQLSSGVLIQQQQQRQWSLRIQDALRTNRFCLYHQPISSTNLEKPEQQHQEILLRMVDEQGNIVLPGAFIPAAERYGLMVEVDRWVIQSLLSYRQNHPIALNSGQRHRLYMLNLSSASIGDRYFCDWLQSELTQSPALARQLCFEISEATVAQDLYLVVSFMNSLKRLGCRFALDDFGSGIYCFKFLQSLPIDYLKIDSSFTQYLTEDPAAYAIVEAINHIGHVMGVETIAEAVQSVPIQHSLRCIGVDYMQGYAIAKPQPLKAMVSQS